MLSLEESPRARTMKGKESTAGKNEEAIHGVVFK